MKGKIFLADSCAGGLGILKFFLKWAGKYDVYYLADGEKNPFGLRSKQEIYKIVESWLKSFNKDKKIVLFCISCNTASISIEKNVKILEKRYKIPIITMIDGAKSIIKEKKDQIKDKKVLLIGTKFTIASRVYKRLIKKEKPKRIFELNGTFSERFVARGLEKDRSAKIKMIKELSKFKNEGIESVYLGCTCYPFITKEIIKIYGNKVTFLDPAEEVSKLAKKILHNKNKNKPLKKCHFYITGDTKEWNNNLNIISRKAFGEKIKAKKIHINR